MQPHPLTGPLGIELRRYRVVLPTLLVDHSDGDQLDGDAILDELAVVEEPHLDRPSPSLTCADVTIISGVRTVSQAPLQPY
jgi:hypothetical protein